MPGHNIGVGLACGMGRDDEAMEVNWRKRSALDPGLSRSYINMRGNIHMSTG